MENNEPNKIVNACFKEYKRLRTVKEAANYDYKGESALKEKLAAITRVAGAIEVMSKYSLIKLVAMQSTLRFMDHHVFYIQFAKACEDINGEY